MNILGLVKRHKIVTSVLAVGIVYSSGVSAIYNGYMESSEPVKEVKQVSKPQVEELPLAVPEKIAEQETIQAPIVQSSPVTEKPIVQVKSTQEYGNMYLDLASSPLLQECFDRIIASWPSRFTEDVREKNIKALSVFGSTCSTGILESNGGVITSYGRNGEFFDSQLAATKH